MFEETGIREVKVSIKRSAEVERHVFQHAPPVIRRRRASVAVEHAVQIEQLPPNLVVPPPIRQRRALVLDEDLNAANAFQPVQDNNAAINQESSDDLQPAQNVAAPPPIRRRRASVSNEELIAWNSTPCISFERGIYCLERIPACSRSKRGYQSREFR